MSAIPTDAFAAIFQLDAIAVNNISVLVLGGNARMIFSDLVNETNSGTLLNIPRVAISIPVENLISFKNDLVALCATLEVTHARQ